MLLRLSGIFRKLFAYALILGGAVIGGVTLLTAPVFATAGINQQLNFQGRLFNTQGAVVSDGYYNMQFKIYQDGPGTTAGNPGGTLKWTEDWTNSGGNGVLVKNGYISVQLGSVTPFGTSVDWNQDTLWLSMNIGNTNLTCTPFSSCVPDGEMVPMKRLTATPYAMNAGMLGGRDASGFIQNSTSLQSAANFNIQGTGQATTFQASTSVLTPSIDRASAGTLTIGTNATNTTAITIGSSNMTTSVAGKLVIGTVTTTPNANLQIVGTLGVIGPVSYPVYFDNSPSSAYWTIDKSNTASDASIVLRDQGAVRGEIGLVTDNNLHFKTVSGAAGSETFTDRLIIQASGETYTTGKLGVGTVPTEQLHIATSSTAGKVITKIENTNTAAGSKSTALQFSSSTNNWSVGTDIGLNGGNNFAIQDNNFGYMPRFFIDSSGRVGIGTDNPTYKLDVAGDFHTTGAATIAGLLSASAGATISGAAINLNASSNFAVNIGTGTTNATVTIGNSSNSTLLSSNTITVGTATATPSNATNILGVAQTNANTAGNAMVIQGSTGLNGNGGTVTVQGGNANGTGTLGGNLTLTGGTGSTSNGAVILATSTFQTATTDASCFPLGTESTSTSNCTFAQTSINNNASVIAGFTADGQKAFMPDPSIVTAGRVVYVTASNLTKDFTLSVNGGGQGNEIGMRKNTTATMIWNGADWTAAGASSSTTLQSAYDNTLQSAGGAELIVGHNLANNNTNGLTIRDSTLNPTTGALVTVQSGSAANLFSVNSNVTEYASNPGAETYNGTVTTTFPASTWVALTGSTVSRNVTTANIATGQGSAQVLTATTAGSGVKNVLTAPLSVGQHYNVSFTAKLPSGAGAFTDMGVYYSVDGTNDTVPCIINQAIKASVWTKVNCAFTASGSPSAANSINIRQVGGGTIRTFFVDNVSVTIAADYNYATDGGVDDNTNFSTNWTLATAGSATGTMSRDVLDGNDASSSAKITSLSNTANAGIRNKLSINPLQSTLYRISVYAKLAAGTFNDFKIRYSATGAQTAGAANYIDCVDYNKQTITTSAWTQITCYITTDATTVTNPYIYFVQTAAPGTTRTFSVDTFSMTLASNSTPNVQIGSGSNGGPTTLFTVDKGASAPIAANNDALLGSMYYDTTLGKLQCYEADGWGACGSSPDNIITISPEYTNAVLHGTGIGTMTSDICSDYLGINDGSGTPAQPIICSTGETYNFYKWTSPQATAQAYSIYVTYQLPSTFKSFNSGQTSLQARVDNTSNAFVKLQIYKNHGGLSTCGSDNTITTSANTWQSPIANGTADPSTCGFAPGDSIVFKITASARATSSAYIGNLNFAFSNK